MKPIIDKIYRKLRPFFEFNIVFTEISSIAIILFFIFSMTLSYYIPAKLATIIYFLITFGTIYSYLDNKLFENLVNKEIISLLLSTVMGVLSLIFFMMSYLVKQPTDNIFKYFFLSITTIYIGSLIFYIYFGYYFNQKRV